MSEIQAAREAIRELVSSISPLDDREKEDLAFTVQWIDSGVEIFRMIKPDHPKIHLVVYGMIFDPQNHSLLLVSHRKAGLWLPPGGHIEVGENPEEAVRREIKEELDIEADFLMEDPLFLTVSKTVGNVAEHTDVTLWYLLNGQHGSHFNYDSEEFHQIQWFKIDQLPSPSDPHLKRLIKKIQKQFTLKSYDSTACEYAEKTATFSPQKEIDTFIDYLPKGARILDVGCGPGRDANVFAQSGL